MYFAYLFHLDVFWDGFVLHSGNYLLQKENNSGGKFSQGRPLEIRSFCHCLNWPPVIRSILPFIVGTLLLFMLVFQILSTFCTS